MQLTRKQVNSIISSNWKLNRINFGVQMRQFDFAARWPYCTDVVETNGATLPLVARWQHRVASCTSMGNVVSHLM